MVGSSTHIHSGSLCSVHFNGKLLVSLIMYFNAVFHTKTSLLCRKVNLYKHVEYK